MSPDERKTPARRLTRTYLHIVLQALEPKRQETDASGPALKAVSFALGGLLMAVAGLVFWLGVQLGEMRVSIENNAKAIERLERGQERIENLLIDFLRGRNGDAG